MREPVIVLRDLTPETRAPLLSSPKAGTPVEKIGCRVMSWNLKETIVSAYVG